MTKKFLQKITLFGKLQKNLNCKEKLSYFSKFTVGTLIFSFLFVFKVTDDMTQEDKKIARGFMGETARLEMETTAYTQELKEELLKLFPSLGGRVVRMEKKLFELELLVIL